MSGNSAAVVSSADNAYVHDVVRRSNSSFTAGMRMLPRARRDALFAVYAFCRKVDDVADEPGELAQKRKELADWRARIEAIYARNADGPLARALAVAIVEYNLRQDDFLAVIDGMEMDAAPHMRIADDVQLAVYCDRVACAVGRLCVRIFGMGVQDGKQLAKSLGEALQLTNILRDLHEDAERDRLYLPADLLAANGIADTHDPMAVLRNPGLPAVCDVIAARAESRYDESRALIAGSERRQVLPAALMMQAYGRVLARLRRRGWHDLEKRVSLSRAEKLWLFIRYGIFGG